MNEPLLCGILTLTPTHCGTGQAAGAIDLPIAREAHTGLPVLPATMLKGVMREWAGSAGSGDTSRVDDLFGPPPPKRQIPGTQSPRREQGTAPLEAGSLVFLDGMLLAFPVRSLTGVFRWVTSPMLVARLRRTLAALGSSQAVYFECPDPGDQILLPERDSGPVSLEDLVFTRDKCQPSQEVSRLAETLGVFISPPPDPERETLKSRLAVVSDAVLQDLTLRGTAVNARIVLDKERKTSQNLWYEETLLPDTLFAVIVADRPGAHSGDGPAPVDRFRGLLRAHEGFAGRIYTRIGGNVTVGQGLVKWLFDVEVGS